MGMYPVTGVREIDLDQKYYIDDGLIGTFGPVNGYHTFKTFGNCIHWEPNFFIPDAEVFRK